ncbi:MAG: MazG-like family protein [Clostridiales bacterium]|jgi:hypothetical protein|nr:MazG-like family protein [Clostridiales bacterium]
MLINHVDITKNIKVIEHQKAELLLTAAQLNMLLSQTEQDSIQEKLFDCVSEIVATSYLLGRKLGMSYNNIEKKVDEKLRIKALTDFAERVEADEIYELIDYRKQSAERKQV